MTRSLGGPTPEATTAAAGGAVVVAGAVAAGGVTATEGALPLGDGAEEPGLFQPAAEGENPRDGVGVGRFLPASPPEEIRAPRGPLTDSGLSDTSPSPTFPADRLKSPGGRPEGAAAVLTVFLAERPLASAWPAPGGPREEEGAEGEAFFWAGFGLDSASFPAGPAVLLLLLGEGDSRDDDDDDELGSPEGRGPCLVSGPLVAGCLALSLATAVFAATFPPTTGRPLPPPTSIGSAGDDEVTLFPPPPPLPLPQPASRDDEEDDDDTSLESFLP